MHQEPQNRIGCKDLADLGTAHSWHRKVALHDDDDEIPRGLMYQVTAMFVGLVSQMCCKTPVKSLTSRERRVWCGVQSHAGYSRCGLGSDGTDRLVALVRQEQAQSCCTKRPRFCMGPRSLAEGLDVCQ